MRNAFCLLILVFVFTTQGCFTDEWCVYRNTNAKFEVQLPGEYKEAQTVKTGTLFGDLTVKYVTCEPKKLGVSKGAYMVMYTKYPETAVHSGMDTGTVNQYFDASIHDAIASKNAALRSQKVIQIDGFPGREVKFDYESEQTPMDMHMKLYLVKHTLYIVALTTGKGMEDEAASTKFFGSFRLLK